MAWVGRPSSAWGLPAGLAVAAWDQVGPVLALQLACVGQMHLVRPEFGVDQPAWVLQMWGPCGISSSGQGLQAWVVMHLQARPTTPTWLLQQPPLPPPLLPLLPSSRHSSRRP